MTRPPLPRSTPPRPTPPRPALPRTAAGRAGLALIAVGALVLIGNAGPAGGAGGALGALLFAALGGLLARRAVAGEGGAWALPVAFALFGLAAAALGTRLAGSAFLAMTGAGFALLALGRPERWWAVIPAGVLASLALVAGLDALPLVPDAGPVLFLGLAATFGLLVRMGRAWAVYPALALLALAVLALAFAGAWLVPLALLAVGAWLLRRGAGPEGPPG